MLLSPLVDLTFTLARTREQLRRDPAIRSRDAARLIELYCAGIDSSPSPAEARRRRAGAPLPPTLIQAGGAEMLAADAIALADDIRAAGGECELQIWPDQVHVFQALPRIDARGEARHAAYRGLHRARPARHRIDKAAG